MVTDTYIFSDVDDRDLRSVIDIVKSDVVYGEREFRGSQGKRDVDPVKRTGVVREDFIHNRRDPLTGRGRGAYKDIKLTS